MLDLLLHNARLPTGQVVDIAIDQGRIRGIEPHLAAEAHRRIDLDGWLVSPPFVDSHFHLDSALTAGQPRHNLSGTLLEGIAIWSELKPTLDEEQIYGRARRLCEMAIAQGNLAIRSHVDTSDPRLTAVRALLRLRDDMRSWLDIQLIAFPQDGYLRLPAGRRQLQAALDLGLDGVGGIPHFERTATEGATSIAELCRLAAERGLPVDMHCDETDDPSSRHIETLAAETIRHGLQGRVTGSHLTSMHSMDNAYAGKLLGLMQQAEVHAIANPLINITLQGRYDSYPRRRGMTRVKELLAAGLRVGFGHDCVMDPWYRLGSHDMLEVASMGAHVGHLTGESELLDCYRAVTEHPAAILGLPDYGLAPGCRADLVVLQARDPIEAIRLRPARLYVIRGGRVIAETAPRHTRLSLHETSMLDLSRLD
ncbi:cytosine deaminase [Frateuria aurantia]